MHRKTQAALIWLRSVVNL